MRQLSQKEDGAAPLYLFQKCKFIIDFDFPQRCDGNQPICGQCDRAGRAEDCEYTTGQERSKVQILEDNISQLEARIQELQNPRTSIPREFQTPASRNMRLQEPYNSSGPTIQDPPRQVAENLYVLFCHGILVL